MAAVWFFRDGWKEGRKEGKGGGFLIEREWEREGLRILIVQSIMC